MSDLKQNAINAAIDLVNQGNLDFSIRDISSILGVSHMGPYKQFGSKEALLAEVASVGFNQLKDQMYRAKTTKSNEDYFTQMGLEYIGFAEDYPYMYRLMFGNAIADHSQFEVLQTTGQGCFSLLVEMISGLQRSGFIVKDDPMNLSFFVWSTMHGFSMISSQGKISNMRKNDKLTEFSPAMKKQNWEKKLKYEIVKSTLRAIISTQ